MSSVYGGNGSLVTTDGFAMRSIVSSTNTSPISVQVTNHGLSTGDWVEIEGHQTNTAANGSWVVTVTDANNFTLNGSTGNGVGGATGYMINYAVHPQITIPSDGDPRNAASVNVPITGNADKIPFLYKRVGKFRTYGIYESSFSDDTWATWSSNAPGVFGSASWAPISGGSALLFGASPQVILATNDVIEVWSTVTVTTSGGNGLAAVGLGVLGSGGTYSLIAGSAIRLPGANQTFLPLSLHGWFRKSGASQTFDVAIMGYGNVGSPQTVNFVGHRQVTVNHYRPN
jgi:hypothetical protein